MTASPTCRRAAAQFPFPLSACALAAALLACSAPALGQAGQPGAVRTLETITVTGERLARSLRDTASSVSVLDDEDLAARPERASVQEAVADTPNVIYPGTVAAPVIRGQDTQGPISGASAFLGGTVPRATVNVDGRYLSYNELVFGSASVWDVQRVEVFRGPQTVTQGANSIAGAVQVHTKDPTFHREAAAQLVAGNLRARRQSVMFSGPIREGELAARFALDHHSRNTFIRYVNPRFARGQSDQDFEALAARLKLLYRPAAAPGLSLKLTLAHGQDNRPTNESANAPYGELQNRTLAMPGFRQWSNSAVLDADYARASDWTLHQRLAFSHLNLRRETEPYTNGGATIGLEEISSETKLTWGHEKAPWRGVAGLFFKRAQSDDLLYIRGVSRFDDRKRNLGAYGEVSHRLGGAGGRWTMSAGLRWQSDHIRRSGRTPFSRAPLAYDRHFHALLPKLSIAWDASARATVGALYSRGYNPGGTGISFAQARAYTFEDESLNNYELFARASLLGGRMLVSGNVFFNQFRQSQRLLPDYLNGTLYGSVVVNADRARARGLELAADWQANAQWRIKGALGLLHSRITRFDAPGGQLLQGREFSRAPRHNLSLELQWQPRADVQVALNARHSARYHSADDNRPAYLVPAYTVLGARASWQITRHLQLFAYAHNLLDKALPVWMHDDRTAGGIVSSVLGPRQLGLGLRADF